MLDFFLFFFTGVGVGGFDDDFGARAFLIYCCFTAAFTAALLLLLLKTGEGLGGFDDNIGTRVLLFIFYLIFPRLVPGRGLVDLTII